MTEDYYVIDTSSLIDLNKAEYRHRLSQSQQAAGYYGDAN